MKNFFGVFRSFSDFGNWLENFAFKEESVFLYLKNCVSKRNAYKKGGFCMKKRKSKDDFNFINAMLNHNKKDVNFCGCSFTVDTVSKRDLNRMQRQKQKLNRKV